MSASAHHQRRPGARSIVSHDASEIDAQGALVCSASFGVARGVRAIGRLLDAFALVLLGFNVLSLGQASFADTLLIYAACLLAVAATLEIGAQSGKDDGDKALGACLNDWLAAIGILCVLLVNTAVKGYFPADDWIALHLTASFLGLLVQIFVFVTLLTAMALGYEGDQMQARKEAAAERFTTPPPRVSEQFYQIVEKSRAVDKLIKDAGDKPKYEDLKKFHEYSVEMERSVKEKHL